MTELDYIYSGCRHYFSEFFTRNGNKKYGIVDTFFAASEPRQFYFVETSKMQAFKDCSEGDNRDEEKMRELCVPFDLNDLNGCRKIG